MTTKELLSGFPDGNVKLRPKTFTYEDSDFLHLGDNLFARKFDDNVDNTIIDEMTSHYNTALNNVDKKSTITASIFLN